MAKKNLRSILGLGGRVTKRGETRPSAPPKVSSPSASSSRPQPRASGTHAADGTEPDEGEETVEQGEDYFHDKLDDRGLLHALATDLMLSDVAQAMCLSRSRMYSPLPPRGLGSQRTSAVLNRRASCPPLTTLTHLYAVLTSPTAVERELHTLAQAGVVRRIAVARRAELLILSRDLEQMVAAHAGVDEATRTALGEWLANHPGETAVPKGTMAAAHADSLLRAGFLVGRSVLNEMDRADGGRLQMRPRERTSLVSLDRVARAASGSVEAVGGTGAVHLAGGWVNGVRHESAGPRLRDASSAGQGVTVTSPEDLDLAVPGQGSFLRLATAGVEHLTSLTRDRSRFSEVPQALLREWWDCATAVAGREEARRARRGAVGVVLASKTTKWRELDGLSFEWVLEEAVGRGLAEVFDAGPVGRAVRLL